MKSVKREGFWRSDSEPELLMPVAGARWEGQREFLECLMFVEGVCKKSYYRGYSRCRVCGKNNGSADCEMGDWVWPDGYTHYLVVHNVRPSEEFEEFILKAGQELAKKEERR